MNAHTSVPFATTEIPAGQRPVLDLDSLVSQFYGDVRRIAHSRLRRLPPSRSLHTATLMQEALLRLARCNKTGWHCRVHFFADVRQAVAQAVADYVRRKTADKRDAHVVRDDHAFDMASHFQQPDPATPAQKLAVHQAMERLGVDEPRAAQVVFYRFYCGLTMPQIAETLAISQRCAERDWTRARVWLAAELSDR